MDIKQTIQRPFSYVQYNFTVILIIINLVVFLITRISQNAIAYLAMQPLLVNNGFIWTFLSYMFVHASAGHILFNMVGLFIFGTQVEQEMGSWEFLFFYLITGVLAGVFSYVVYVASGQYYIFLVGASGALYGVMLAFATYYPNARVFILGLIPVRSVTLVIIFTVFAIFNQITGLNGSVAHMTHLAGLLFAFLYFIIRLGINPLHKWRR
ncbi:MAG: rhomboid family intramembrane serine protease [Salinispira sp.]